MVQQMTHKHLLVTRYINDCGGYISSVSDLFMKPLGEYVCLKLERVLESAESDEPIPFILRRLVSREYNVGPEGAVIGTSSDCTVCIPRDSGVCARHVAIRWVPGSTGGTSFQCLSVRRGSKLMRQDCFDGHGHFVLEDLTGGSGVFCVTYNATSLQHSAIPEDTEEQRVVKVSSPAGDQSDQSIKSQSGGVTPLEVGGAQGEVEGEGSALHLMHGVQFVTGQLEWSITALPLEKMLTLKMFAAARKGDLDELRSILDSNKCTDVTVPGVFVTPTDREGGGGWEEVVGEWGRWEEVGDGEYTFWYMSNHFPSPHIPTHCDTSTTLTPTPHTGGCSLVLCCYVQQQRQETILRWSDCYQQRLSVPMLVVSDTKMLSTLPLHVATARWSSFSS